MPMQIVLNRVDLNARHGLKGFAAEKIFTDTSFAAPARTV